MTVGIYVPSVTPHRPFRPFSPFSWPLVFCPPTCIPCRSLDLSVLLYTNLSIHTGVRDPYYTKSFCPSVFLNGQPMLELDEKSPVPIFICFVQKCLVPPYIRPAIEWNEINLECLQNAEILNIGYSVSEWTLTSWNTWSVFELWPTTEGHVGGNGVGRKQGCIVPR